MMITYDRPFLKNEGPPLMIRRRRVDFELKRGNKEFTPTRCYGLKAVATGGRCSILWIMKKPNFLRVHGGAPDRYMGWER